MSAFQQLLERSGAARNEPLAPHTFLKIGGPADWFLPARSNDLLETAIRAAREEGVPVLILGAGTNTLVGDRGVRGLVIKQECADFNVPEAGGGDEYAVIESGAGALFTALARGLSARGWRGIEWAEGIPGSMGGAVVYNAGAYCGSLADVLLEVDCIRADGSPQTFAAADLQLGYRSSDFTRGRLPDWVVARVRIRLERGDPAASTALVRSHAEQRKRSAPRGLSGGSTFRNPPGDQAWRLIDEVGLRGRRIGDAQISAEHCNYFMNVGRATAADLTALIRLAQQRVRDRFGIELDPELTSVGEGFE